MSEYQHKLKEVAVSNFLKTVSIKKGYYNTREIFMIYRDYRIWCEENYPGVPRFLRTELTSKLYARQDKLPMSKL